MDESGILTESDERSRFYILTLVCHDQSVSIEAAEKALVHDLASFGIVNLCFHAGPVIHANDQFEFLSWDLRRRIFTRMMGFVRRIKFGYRCLVIDKKYANTKEQMVSRLYDELTSFFDAQRGRLSGFDQVKVYYDCGQKAVTNLLHDFFAAQKMVDVDFAQAVEPKRYRLFQVADLACTLTLLETKLVAGVSFSKSEMRFFGGPRFFKRNILKYLKRKQI